MLVTLGLGLDDDNLAPMVTLGLGLNPLTPPPTSDVGQQARIGAHDGQMAMTTQIRFSGSMRMA